LDAEAILVGAGAFLGALAAEEVVAAFAQAGDGAGDLVEGDLEVGGDFVGGVSLPEEVVKAAELRGEGGVVVADSDGGGRSYGGV